METAVEEQKAASPEGLSEQINLKIELAFSPEKSEIPALEQAIQEFTKQYLQHLYSQTKGNVREAAQIAGVYRQSMYRMLGRFNIFEKRK